VGLTINDVEKLSFPGSLFGYRRTMVEDFRADVVEALQELVDEMARLKNEIDRLSAELDRYRATEKLLQESVILAQKSHDQIVAAAQQQAESILQEARLKAVELSHELGTLSAERERFAYEFHALLKGFLERLEQTQPQLATGTRVPTEAATKAPISDEVAPQKASAFTGGEAGPSLLPEESQDTQGESPFPDESPRK